MKVMHPGETLTDLVCSACRASALVWSNNEPGQVACAHCGRTFPCSGPIMDFLLRERLDNSNMIELKGNDIDIHNPDVIASMANKDTWSPVYIHSLMHAMEVVHKFIAHYPSDTTLYSLGSGTGFELKILCSRRKFKRVYSSDLSWTATSIVPTTLSSLEGQIGLFVSEFTQSPVPKRQGNLGLVFQALHHTADIHKTVEHLLKHTFDDLVIVEPSTNWLVEILASIGLAKRVEYSGLKPSWMDLGIIKKIAKRNGYETQIQTWWEFPPGLARFVDWNKCLTKAVTTAVDFLSWITGLFQFGSMSAVLFTKRAPERANGSVHSGEQERGHAAG